MNKGVHAYKKQNKTYYQFRDYLGTDPISGKKKEVTRSGFKSKREAKLELDRLKYEYEHSNPLQNTNITYGEVFEMWYKVWSTTVVESTQNRVSGIFKHHILPVFSMRPISKLDVRFCQKYVDTLASDTKSVASIRKTGSYVGAVFRHAIRLGYIKNNPMTLAIYPKNNVTQSNNFWNKDQLKQFLKILDEHYADHPQMRTYFYLSAVTACRKGELLALQWKDVNFQERSININKTVTRTLDNSQAIGKPKTANSNRVIYIDDRTVQLLKEWKTKQKAFLQSNGSNTIKIDQFIFTTSENTLLSLMTPNHWLTKIINRFNLKQISPHGLRHTVATLLSQSGIPIKQIQMQLGDSDASIILNTYTHVDEAIKKETTQKFSSFLAL